MDMVDHDVEIEDVKIEEIKTDEVVGAFKSWLVGLPSLTNNP